MAEVVLPNDYKVLALNLKDLPINLPDDVIIYCANCNDVLIALNEHPRSTIIIACRSNELIGLDVLLTNRFIDTLYILNVDKDDELREWLDGLLFINMIQVDTEKEFMRRLYLKIFLCSYNQAEEYKRSGDMGLANRWWSDALNAGNEAKKLI